MSDRYTVAAAQDHAAEALATIQDVAHGEHPEPADLLQRVMEHGDVEMPFVIRVLHERFGVRAERDGDQIVIVISAKGEMELEGQPFGVARTHDRIQMEEGRVVDLEVVASVSEGSHAAEPSGGDARE